MKKFACLFLFILLFSHTTVFAQPELDTSFDNDGIFTTGAIRTILSNALVQPDNKPMFFSGACRDINTRSFVFCFIRLNENGSYDQTFNDNDQLTPTGTALYAVPGADPNNSSGAGFALQSDGKILGVGFATISGTQRPVMIRLNPNGSIDSTFGTNGISISSFVGYFLKVVIQPDGKIVCVGESGNNQLAARFLTDGTPDNTFGDSGFKILINPNGNTTGNSVALQADGKIVIGGALTSASAFYLLTRLNSDGSLDTTFDDDGYKSIASNGSFSLTSIAVKSDGRIVALGNNILYQLNSNGSPDTSFDSDGSRSALNGNAISYRMLNSASGRITVVGYNDAVFGNGPWYYRTARYLSNGAPDMAYSGDGFLDIDIPESPLDGADSVAFDTQGRLIIGGRNWSGVGDYPWQNSNYSAVRLLAQPAQNVGFTGRVTKTDGGSVANAYLTLKNGNEIIGYARTNPFGYFRFANLPSNVTYTLSTVSKNLNFYDRSVLVDEAIENFLVVGE